MKINKSISKQISLAMSVAMLWPSLSWSFQVLPAGGAGLSYQQQPIKLPQSLGTMSDYHLVNNRPLVICVQDLHCHQEVQHHISDIIHYFAANHELRLVGEEGAYGQVNVKKYQSFPDQTIRQLVSDYFVQQGQLTGAEYAAINGNLPIDLVGLENPDMYSQSQDLVRSFLTDEQLGLIQDVRDYLIGLREQVYHQQLLDFDDQVINFQTGKIELTDYTLWLSKQARRAGLNLKDYPALRATGSDVVYQELERLEQAVRATMVTNHVQRAFDDWRRRLDLMDKGLNISLTTAELEQIRTQPAHYSIKTMIEFLQQHFPEESSHLFSDWLSLDQKMAEVLRFYELADRRSHAFVQQFSRQMVTKQQSLGLMVFGGFHAQAIMEQLRQADLGYITIRPRLSKIDSINPYFRLLQDRRQPLEKLLATSQRMMGLPSRMPHGQVSSSEVMTTDRLTREPQRVFSRMFELLSEMAATYQAFRKSRSLTKAVTAVKAVVQTWQGNEIDGVALDQLLAVNEEQDPGRALVVPTTQGLTALVTASRIKLRQTIQQLGLRGMTIHFLEADQVQASLKTVAQHAVGISVVTTILGGMVYFINQGITLGGPAIMTLAVGLVLTSLLLQHMTGQGPWPPAVLAAAGQGVASLTKKLPVLKPGMMMTATGVIGSSGEQAPRDELERVTDEIRLYPRHLIHSSNLELDEWDRENYRFEELDSTTGYGNWVSNHFPNLILGTWEDVEKATLHNHQKMKFHVVERFVAAGDETVIFYYFDNHAYTVPYSQEAVIRGEIPKKNNTQIFLDEHFDFMDVLSELGFDINKLNDSLTLREYQKGINRYIFMNNPNWILAAIGFLGKHIWLFDSDAESFREQSVDQEVGNWKVLNINNYQIDYRRIGLKRYFEKNDRPMNCDAMLNIDTDIIGDRLGVGDTHRPAKISAAYALKLLQDFLFKIISKDNITISTFHASTTADLKTYGDVEIVRFLARTAPALLLRSDQAVSHAILNKVIEEHAPHVQVNNAQRSSAGAWPWLESWFAKNLNIDFETYRSRYAWWLENIIALALTAVLITGPALGMIYVTTGEAMVEALAVSTYAIAQWLFYKFHYLTVKGTEQVTIENWSIVPMITLANLLAIPLLFLGDALPLVYLIVPLLSILNHWTGNQFSTLLTTKIQPFLLEKPVSLQAQIEALVYSVFKVIYILVPFLRRPIRHLINRLGLPRTLIQGDLGGHLTEFKEHLEREGFIRKPGTVFYADDIDVQYFIQRLEDGQQSPFQVVRRVHEALYAEYKVNDAQVATAEQIAGALNRVVVNQMDPLERIGMKTLELPHHIQRMAVRIQRGEALSIEERHEYNYMILDQFFAPGINLWQGGQGRVIQVGDWLDRGQDSLPTHNYLVRLQADADKKGGQVVRIAGNHEKDLIGQRTRLIEFIKTIKKHHLTILDELGTMKQFYSQAEDGDIDGALGALAAMVVKNDIQKSIEKDIRQGKIQLAYVIDDRHLFTHAGLSPVDEAMVIKKIKEIRGDQSSQPITVQDIADFLNQAFIQLTQEYYLDDAETYDVIMNLIFRENLRWDHPEHAYQVVRSQYFGHSPWVDGSKEAMGFSVDLYHRFLGIDTGIDFLEENPQDPNKLGRQSYVVDVFGVVHSIRKSRSTGQFTERLYLNQWTWVRRTLQWLVNYLTDLFLGWLGRPIQRLVEELVQAGTAVKYDHDPVDVVAVMDYSNTLVNDSDQLDADPKRMAELIKTLEQVRYFVMATGKSYAVMNEIALEPLIEYCQRTGQTNLLDKVILLYANGSGAVKLNPEGKVNPLWVAESLPNETKKIMGQAVIKATSQVNIEVTSTDKKGALLRLLNGKAKADERGKMVKHPYLKLDKPIMLMTAGDSSNDTHLTIQPNEVDMPVMNLPFFVGLKNNRSAYPSAMTSLTAANGGLAFLKTARSLAQVMKTPGSGAMVYQQRFYSGIRIILQLLVRIWHWRATLNLRVLGPIGIALGLAAPSATAGLAGQQVNLDTIAQGLAEGPITQFSWIDSVLNHLTLDQAALVVGLIAMGYLLYRVMTANAAGGTVTVEQAVGEAYLKYVVPTNALVRAKVGQVSYQITPTGGAGFFTMILRGKFWQKQVNPMGTTMTFYLPTWLLTARQQLRPGGLLMIQLLFRLAGLQYRAGLAKQFARLRWDMLRDDLKQVLVVSRQRLMPSIDLIKTHSMRWLYHIQLQQYLKLSSVQRALEVHKRYTRGNQTNQAANRFKAVLRAMVADRQNQLTDQEASFIRLLAGFTFVGDASAVKQAFTLQGRTIMLRLPAVLDKRQIYYYLNQLGMKPSRPIPTRWHQLYSSA